MNRFSFDETINKLDLIVSEMKCADAKNDAMFRRICREIFQNSYSKLTEQNNLNTISRMAIVGAVSAYKKYKGQYNEGSFAKSFRKLNSQSIAITYSNLDKVNPFLKISEFALVVKLLKIQYNFGLNKAISSINYD
jgi:hypothetical protein